MLMNIQEATLSTKLKDNKNKFLIGTAAIVGILGMAAPAAGALGFDSVDLGTGYSTHDGDESSTTGLRVLSTDDAENIGVGAVSSQTDGDESSTIGTQVESTDNLENNSVTSDAATTDGDESSSVSTGVETSDDLENVSIDAEAVSVDGDESSNFGVNFGFEE